MSRQTDRTYACDYNPAADDFNKVPGWSTVDIKTPKESRIKPWYVYAPDIPDLMKASLDFTSVKVAITSLTLHQRALIPTMNSHTQ